MKLLISLLFCCLFANSSVAQKSSQPIKNPDFITKKNQISQILVNNKIISSSDLKQRMILISQISKLNLKQKTSLSFQRIVANKLIEEELIRQKSEIYQIKIDNAEIENSIENFAIKYFKNTKNFYNFFKKNSLNIDNFRKQIEAEIIWNKILYEVIKPTVSVSMIEVKEWLEKDKINKNSQKFLFKDYLVGPISSSDELIKKFHQEISGKKDYALILKNFLNSSREDQVGNNWLWSSEINPQILTRISSLSLGQISEPIKLEDGYHIIELVDKRSDVNINDQELDFIKKQILSRKFEMSVKLYLDDLKKRAFIEIIE